MSTTNQSLTTQTEAHISNGNGYILPGDTGPKIARSNVQKVANSGGAIVTTIALDRSSQLSKHKIRSFLFTKNINYTIKTINGVPKLAVKVDEPNAKLLHGFLARISPGDSEELRANIAKRKPGWKLNSTQQEGKTPQKSTPTKNISKKTPTPPPSFGEVKIESAGISKGYNFSVGGVKPARIYYLSINRPELKNNGKITIAVSADYKDKDVQKLFLKLNKLIDATSSSTLIWLKKLEFNTEKGPLITYLDSTSGKNVSVAALAEVDTVKQGIIYFYSINDRGLQTETWFHEIAHIGAFHMRALNAIYDFGLPNRDPSEPEVADPGAAWRWVMKQEKKLPIPGYQTSGEDFAYSFGEWTRDPVKFAVLFPYRANYINSIGKKLVRGNIIKVSQEYWKQRQQQAATR